MSEHRTVVEDAGESTLPTASGGEALRVGDTLGPYRLSARIGAGGMGVVYAAEDPRLHRHVALKVLWPGLATRPHRIARMRQEARAMAQLSHPNVVQVYDAGEDGGQVWLAMERVDGEGLDRWLARARRPREEILAAFVEAGRGLAAAHAASLVHRDFKPGNVLVGEDGRVKVTDFGLARTLVDPTRGDPPAGVDADTLATPHAARTGMAGTPLYMAPEQHGGGEVDARADQYAFCLALYEALRGEPVFDRLGLRTLEGKKREGVPVDLPRGCIRNQVAVVRALRRGLSPAREDRFATMDDLLAALQPRRSAVRAFIAVGVLAGLGVVGFVAFGPDEVPQPDCGGPWPELQAQWPGRASEIATALRATRSPNADAATERVSARLEAWAEAWAAARRRACVSASEDPARADLERACRERGRGKLTAHLDALSRADAAVVEHAVAASRALPDPAACIDPARAPGDTPAPPAELASTVEEVRGSLSRIDADLDAGRFRVALEPARAAATSADAIGWPPLSAEAWFALGRAQAAVGEAQAAEDSLVRAYHRAEASGYDAVAADVATALVRQVGYAQARFDEGETWARHADAAASRLADGHEALASLRAAEGSLHMRAGELARAENALHAAQAAWTDAGVDDERLGGVHQALGAVLVKRGRYADAVVEYEEALDIERRALGDEHPAVATTLGGLGAAAYLMNDYERAAAYQREALALRERTFGPSHPQVAVALNNLGIAVLRLGDPAESLALHRRALRIREATLDPDHPDIAESLNNIGVVFQERGELDEAQRWFRRSLDVQTRRLGPDHPDLAQPLNNLGAVERLRGHPEAALGRYERALEIGTAAFGPSHPIVATARLGMGEARLAMGEAEAALDDLEAGYAGLDGGPGRRGEAAFALARCLEALGRDEARRRALLEEAAAAFATVPAAAAELPRIRAALAALDGEATP